MAIKAFLVARPGVEIPKSTVLAKHLRGKIEPYKMPREFEWIAELPRTASGKLQRVRLAEQVSGAAVKAMAEPEITT
jgi:acyl-coenzyme A synthetase/AMP-(fatty) acid ligase